MVEGRLQQSAGLEVGSGRQPPGSGVRVEDHSRRRGVRRPQVRDGGEPAPEVGVRGERRRSVVGC